MLLDGAEKIAVDVESAFAWTPQDVEHNWRTVDRALRSISARRATLDAEEAHWLREAEAVRIWRPLGMVSMIDYLERTLGYALRTAQDRLRVARALGGLPRLTAALAGGELQFSTIRELTRVATPATEQAWVAAAAGKNLRQVEDLVAHHRPGDDPDDPPDPEVRTHVVRFELSAETFALLRQARGLLNDEHETNLADDAFVAALCGSVLDGAATSEPTGRAKFQLAITVCRRCNQGWQEGAGVQVPISAAAVDRAMCDAQHIGSIDGSAPDRAYQDVSPSVARFVWRRDGGRCRVDGCRSSRGLELHHIVHRTDGGSHDACNIALICSTCHQSHHAGVLTISGTADRLEARRPAAMVDAGVPRAVAAVRIEPAAAAPCAIVGELAPANGGSPPREAVDAHVGAPNRLDAAVVQAKAKAALTGLGWKPAVARAAIAAALATRSAEMTLEQLIFESLRNCPVPKA